MVGWAVWWAMGIVWIGLAMSHTPQGGHLGTGLVATGLALVAVAVAGLLVCGYLLGRDRRWSYACILSAYVTGLMATLYVAAMLTGPDPDGTNDNAAGMGLAILGLPTLAVVFALVALGFGTRLIGGWMTRVFTTVP